MVAVEGVAAVVGDAALGADAAEIAVDEAGAGAVALVAEVAADDVAANVVGVLGVDKVVAEVVAADVGGVA